MNTSNMPAIAVSEHTTEMDDGAEIFYRAWLTEGPTDKVLVMFHRGHEHSGRLADVAEGLGLSDTAVFAWDARGHGKSSGDRGYAPSFGQMVKDVDTFVRHICEEHGFAIENMVVLAHSVGAVTVSTWVHDYAPRIRALVLATPAFKVKLYVPLAIPALRLLRKIKGGKKSFVKSYVKGKLLTHDKAQAKRYDEDPLIARAIAVNVLLDMRDTAERIVADAGAIRVPTMVCCGSDDWVVSVPVQRQFFSNLGSSVKEMHVFDGMYHDILHEKDRHLVLTEISRFVEAASADPVVKDTAYGRQPLLDAHEQGYTFDEHARLMKPLTPLSPAWLFYGFQSLTMKVFGRLSRGVRLGQETGFDSGKTLDYVYENRPQGELVVGKMVDHAYLNSIGWRGIRQRKVHLEMLLKRAIGAISATGSEVRILDIATGAGRYVLDAVRDTEQACGDVKIDALLRDYTQANLDVGMSTAQSMGLQNVKFEQGDAFDEESVAAAHPGANIAIVSGLYELFADNAMIMDSLRGLERALRGGAQDSGGTAYLVYTGQPWHPQLEMISRVLTNRDGEPWVMRRRTQEEMDDLVRAAGFEKVAMEIDNDGIFTVSLAKLSSVDTAVA